MSTALKKELESTITQTLKQKYGATASVVIIEETMIAICHYVYIVSVGANRSSQIVILNIMKINRGWQIQVYEQVHQVFKPS